MEVDLEFSDRALAELAEAIDNYLLVSTAIAERFAEDHDRSIQNLMLLPRIGSSLPGGRFSIPVPNSGYRIVYRVDGRKLTILQLNNMRRHR